MITSMIGKITERSPLKYTLVSNMICLDPRYIVAHPNSAETSFRRVLEQLSKAGWKDNRQCDSLQKEYRSLVTLLSKDFKQECSKFDEKKDRLDDFLFDTVGVHKRNDTKEVFALIMMLLTMFHGQADVERGFSINSDMLQPNMKKETIKAMRMVHNGLATMGVKSVDTFDITPHILQSVK